MANFFKRLVSGDYGVIGKGKKILKKLKGKEDKSKKYDLQTKKIAAKEYKQGHPYRKEAMQRQQQFASGTDPLSQRLQQEFGIGGNAYQGTQGYEQAKAVFDPIRADARREFNQSTLPDVLNTFGRGSKASSALNQALGSAAQDLETRMSAQLSMLYENERRRQQEMAYNTTAGLYNAQAGANQNMLTTGNPSAQISQQAGRIPPDKNSTQRAADIILPVAGGALSTYFTGNPAPGVQAGNAINQGLQSR